jgi:cell division protein FtsB
MRNFGLEAEVRDLKQGYDAIEERARFELGMIKSDEVFVQLPERAPERTVEKTVTEENAAKNFSPRPAQTK